MFSVVATLAVGVSSAWAQQIHVDEAPAACRDANTEAQYRACVEATPPGSGFHWLSLMHLGMIAMQQQNVAEAVRLFDMATPASGETVTRPRLHAYRAAAYSMVGRDDDALREAHLTLSLLLRTREAPSELWPLLEDTQINNEAAYAAIIPILRDAGDPGFEAALSAYLALPVENWGSAAIRAAMLESIGRFEEALIFSNQAIAAQPAHPLVLNNHCYLLAQMGRPADALPFCEEAVSLASSSAATRHSYATALAALGRCEEARSQEAEAFRLDSVTRRPDIVCAEG